jgi:hypothetical protein
LLGKHQKKSTALYQCISEVVSVACNFAHGLAGVKKTTMKFVQRYRYFAAGGADIAIVYLDEDQDAEDTTQDPSRKPMALSPEFNTIRRK